MSHSQKALKKRWMNNGEISTTVIPTKVDDYLNNGWVLGRLSVIFVTNANEELQIVKNKDFDSNLSKYLTLGYEKGRLKNRRKNEKE